MLSPFSKIFNLLPNKEIVGQNRKYNNWCPGLLVFFSLWISLSFLWMQNLDKFGISSPNLNKEEVFGKAILEDKNENDQHFRRGIAKRLPCIRYYFLVEVRLVFSKKYSEIELFEDISSVFNPTSWKTLHLLINTFTSHFGKNLSCFHFRI